MELPVRARKNSAASTTKRQQQQAPRPTLLVLPRELRNQIYGYLLSHEYTKMPPYHTRPAAARGRQSEANKRDLSAAHTYRLHVNILAVNKQINKEAAEELLLRNTFVVVSWEWYGLSDLLNKFDIPIITDNQKAVANFKMHALRLHLKHPQRRGSVQSLLMLHSDLRVFCKAIRYLNATQEASGVFVFKLKDEFRGENESGFCFLPIADTRDTVFRTRIQFNRVKADSEQELAIKKIKLLETFEHLRIARQNLTVHGIEGGNEESILRKTVDDLMDMAGPPLVWLRLLAWDLLGIMLGLIAAANKLCRDGEYGRALEHYKAIYSGPAADSIILAEGLVFLADRSDVGPPVVMALRALLDAATAAGWLYLREPHLESVSQSKAAEEYGHRITAMISTFSNRQEILGYPDDEMIACWLGDTPYWHFCIVIGFIQGEFDLDFLVNRLEELHDTFPNNAHVAHDLLEATNLQDDDTFDALASREHLVELFSVRALPPQTFVFQIPEHHEFPTNYAGWYDGEQYEAALAAFDEHLVRARKTT
ncbi:hypothetical protein NU219Hw_g9034t1 [Hortaea werneckii]